MRIRIGTLRKIIAETTRLTEEFTGWKNADGSPWTPPPARGKKKKVVAVDGAYAYPSRAGQAYAGEFVTDPDDHPLDQLQTILDMGVKLVDDSDGMTGLRKIEDWKRQVISVATDPAEKYDEIFGPPTRWRG